MFSNVFYQGKPNIKDFFNEPPITLISDKD